MGACCCKQTYEDVDFTTEPNLSHFNLQKLIGQGAFGKVRIVQHKKTKKQYALKYMDKSICLKQRAVDNILSERTILGRIHHAFITNLRYAFQDDDTLFLALDPMLGGDLRFHLEQQRTLPELQVRHYVACIALSLSYLGSKWIAHRDIKPENILLDQNNHAHLSDFNVAIQFSPQQPYGWSRSGTAAYMAPEMLCKKGYSTSVDWWSLGILTFELLFGLRPFRAPSKNMLTQSIIQDPLVFPPDAYKTISVDCMNFISGLLDKSPYQRLGCHTDDFENFKSHPWFQGLDWSKLEKKQLVSPCRLKVKREHTKETF
ncbi:kinase-like domain-containing protein [Sporodiniella umbellata]|nr:kinase-like domain-containing protein [Sporodiniella umbellata]